MGKIIIVTRNMQSGGAERVISQLANYFVKKEHKCKIITLYKNDIFYHLNKNVEIDQISVNRLNKLADKADRYYILRRMVIKERPDVVLALPEEIGIYVLLALLGTGIPVYVSERNNPWVMPYKKSTRFLRRIMYPFADGIIFQTKMAMSFFPKRIQSRGTVIPNPVDKDRIPKKYTGKRTKTIVAAGRLEKQKNFACLIQAFKYFNKQNNEYCLTIYGEGTQRKELEALITSLGLSERVKLPGRSEDLLNLINPTAMFVLSSDYEGLPNVLIEAMCMGMPVISTDCPSGGPKELIDSGTNGILVPVNNPSELANAMLKMTNEDYAKKMGDAAFLIKEQLTDEEIFEKWESFLNL